MSNKLPVLPLRDVLIFPDVAYELQVGRIKSIKSIDNAAFCNDQIILVAQKDAKLTDIDSSKDLFDVGVLADIVGIDKLPNGSYIVTILGKQRVNIKSYKDHATFTECEYTLMVDIPSTKVEEEAFLNTIKSNYNKLAKSDKNISVEKYFSLSKVETATQAADSLSMVLDLPFQEKQKILEMESVNTRCTFIIKKLKERLEIVEAQVQIEKNIGKQMEKNQKEYYLREQLEAIQKELGEKGEDELAEFAKKAETKLLSKEAKDKVLKELKKLKQLQPMSAESGVIRNYLDQILSLPWGEYSVDNYDIKNAEMVLERDSYGMKKTKERIIEQLAVMQMSKGTKASIICLHGSPGTGKTSIAKSIADSLGKQFTRISLGGVRDESEIRGHRRTYVGAMPGKILSALKKMNTSNPVILLDEIDKMTSDQRGDPGAAMLEVLDPSQNATFVDHFLDLEYDLSKVTFICTANDLSRIPRPLLDRMELIKVESYITSEKFEIAKRHLIPKQIKEFSLQDYKITFTDRAILDIIEFYTSESGVRMLERTIASILRKVTKNILKSRTKVKGVKVDQETVVKLLGEHRNNHGKIEATNQIGLTNGMAWTEVGGDLLQVEVVTSPGKGNMVITGSLGDVMKESCSTAFTVVKTLAPKYKIDASFFEKNDIHVHFPDGATPKDGPSAGITVVTSMISAITKRPVRRDVSMTGEVSIRGKVMPIGGLKEKVLAAHRGGIKVIICPEENKKDIKDIPKEVLKDLKIVTASQIETVLKIALT